MIDKIINDIVSELNKLKLKQSKEWFDTENVPDSIIDNSFVIAPVALGPGGLAGTNNKSAFERRILNVEFPLKIFYSNKIKANNITQLIKDSGLGVENIINSISSMDVGDNEKDSISFVGSTPTVIGNVLVNEINFNINYRIN